MPAAKPIQTYRLILQYPPAPTKTGGAYVKDQEGVKNFGDSALLNLQQKDVIDVERTHNEARGQFPASFNIVKWSPAADMVPDQPKPQLVPRQTRPRTDPHDQMQIFIIALMKEWMTAYSATLMLSAIEPNSAATMRPVNAQVIVRAMEALATAYRQFHGIRTQSGEDLQEPPPREDMNEIPDFR